MFLSHLHSDHHADLASLYVNAMFGRKVPLEVCCAFHSTGLPSQAAPVFACPLSVLNQRMVLVSFVSMYCNRHVQDCCLESH